MYGVLYVNSINNIYHFLAKPISKSTHTNGNFTESSREKKWPNLASKKKRNSSSSNDKLPRIKKYKQDQVILGINANANDNDSFNVNGLCVT